MNTRRIIGSWLMIGSMVFVLSSCGGGNKTKDVEASLKNVQNEKSETIQKVSVEKVFVRDVAQEENYTATVVANTTNNIAPKTISRIEKVFVEVGDNVKKGQILAKMEATSLTQVEGQMRNDSLELSRAKQLFEVGGNSKSELDARQLAYTISKTNYDNLLENTVLRSPISGMVTQRNYDNGDMFSMALPLYVVEQIAPVKIKVNVSESFFTDIKKGMKVNVRCDVYGDRVFNGVVNLIYPTIDAATRTFAVEVIVPNSDYAIRPGMFARVNFEYGTKQRVVVPDRAIQKLVGSGNRYVYVVENGTAVYKEVKLGRRMDTEYEIIDGLNNGDDVVVEGFARITDGSKVEVVK